MGDGEIEKKRSDQPVEDGREEEKAQGLKSGAAGADGCAGVDGETPIDLERGITIGSLDAADIPIPTNLRRSVPSPGAYGQPGPRAGLTEISVGSDHSNNSSSSNSNNNNRNDEILVTARLVDEESHHNDIANATVTSAGTKPTLVVAVPAPQEEDDDDDDNPSIPRKNHRVFWTRRNKLVAFILGAIIMGVVIGLSIAVATESGEAATTVTPALGTRGDSAALPEGGSGAVGNDETSSKDKSAEEGSDDRTTTSTTASTAPDQDEEEEEEGEEDDDEDNTDD